MGLGAAAAVMLGGAALAVGAATSALAFTVEDTASLGSASSTTASCDTDGVHLGGWTTSLAPAGPVVTGAVLDQVSPVCVGKTAIVSFAAADGSSLGTAQFTIAGEANAFTFGAVPVAALHSTAVTISG